MMSRYIFNGSLFNHTKNNLTWSKLPLSVFNNQRHFSRFTQEEIETHRRISSWSESFRKEHIPFASLEKNFSRSSGPGGQNVNKVNSKAEIRFPLYSATWILPEVREKVKVLGSRYYNNIGEIVITAEVHRTQQQNLEECRTKLFELIQECSKVPKETSEEQKKKVAGLKSAYDHKRLDEKKKLKEKKQSRHVSSSRYD